MNRIDTVSSNPSVAEIRGLPDEELNGVAGGDHPHFYRPVPYWVRQTIYAMVQGAAGSAMPGQ